MKREELFELIKNAQILTDFELIIEDLGFTWKKETKESIYTVYLGYIGYPDNYQFQTPYSTLYNKQIEKIISDNSEELKIRKIGYDYTAKVNFNNLVIDRQSFTRILKSKEDFVLAVKELKKYISFSKDFFNSNQKLFELSILLSKKKPNEIVPYIHGAQLFVKTILILKEANHPNYEEKRDEFYSVLKTQANKKEVYADQLRLFESLFFS